MGQTQRRPGFLRWGENPRAEEADGAATQAEGTPEEAPAVEDVAEQAEKPGEAPPTASEAAVADANPFLRDLVGAMRGVAESSRDTNLAELRQSVEQRVEELKAAATARAEELRRRSELDLGGIGDWERGELERVRAEAEERRKTRRELLEKELADHQAATDSQMDATRARLGDYEHELEAFFAQLTEIEDPAAFVAAAKRMPAPPDVSAPGTGKPAAPAKESPAVPSSSGTDPLAARLAQLNQRLGTVAAQPSEPEPATESADAPEPAPSSEPAPSPEAEPVATAPAPGGASTTATVAAPAAAPPANGTTAEVSTPIVVKGLGSFGAITSFKQALERVDGIRGVTLSLGPTGDFVYRASHTAEFDVVGAIRSIEGPNVGIEEADGQLRVTIERPR